MDIELLGAKLAELTQKLVDMEGLQAENSDLRNRLAGQGNEPMPHQQPTPVTVHVKAPTPAPRLGVFTGLKPKGGGEVGYNEWHERVTQYAQESQEPQEVARRVRASLRGIAAEQAKNCDTADAILQCLSAIYGDVKTTEDLYLEFVRLQMGKTELPSDFFSRVWSRFTDLNKDGAYPRPEAAKKVYHTFMMEAKANHSLLSLELRNAFGFPGSASPDPSKVLRRIRELESQSHTSPSGSKHATAAATSTSAPGVDIDYDKLATLVAEKMSTQHPQVAHQAAPRPRTPRGPCFRCGEVGTHYRRDCRNPPNPTRVAAAKQQYGLN